MELLKNDCLANFEIFYYTYCMKLLFVNIKGVGTIYNLKENKHADLRIYLSGMSA